MSDHLLRLYVWTLGLAPDRAVDRRRSERGEGVISVAIAVLIMAFLGVMVWGGFKMTMGKTQAKVDQQVEKIGE